MWAAAAPLPYYSAYGFGTAGRPQSSKKPGADASKKDGTSPSTTTRPGTRSDAADVRGLLEPAVDGPPSPERLRALSKQMKRASAMDTSGSSSLRSLNQGRPSWEQTLEHISLSRRSSGRSTSSSMPSSRERPESIQLFGKTIFNRRGRVKRESSANSSSGSSLYSTDLPLDGPVTPSAKDHYMPGLFGRRKAQKSADLANERPPSSSGPKKLNISGPYNFQHVTHTRLPKHQRGGRSDGPQLVTPDSADAGHFANFSSETLPFQQQDSPLAECLTQISPNRPSPQPHVFPQQHQRQPQHQGTSRRLIKRTRSQEHLRTGAGRAAAPPRPPRSPADTNWIPPCPPIPPPRMSSRASVRYDGFDPILAPTLNRPITSGGFRQPQPFSPGPTSHGEPPTPHEDAEYLHQEPEAGLEPVFSHAITTPDDAAWPLTANAAFTYDAALPDVPEEDEHHMHARRSRLSLASNNSSLRGSHSVPMLRQSAQLQAAAAGQRPSSGASDTLGRFDIVAARRALKAAAAEGGGTEALPRESWEDDIDYCYEHEAEADFDYAWDRPSLDMVRETDVLDRPSSATGEPLADTEGGLGVDGPNDAEPQSAGLKPVPARHFDIPALSPVSLASTANAHEAITPTAPSMLITSTYLHSSPETPAAPTPMTDGAAIKTGAKTAQRSPDHLHVRTASQASSFKESHGFTLSPSLLIPGDFQQQMRMAESNMDMYGEDLMGHEHPSLPYNSDELPITISPSGIYIHDRTSTSTSASNVSDETGSSSERHISTNSTFTTLTRYTGSTTFEGWNPKALEAAEPLPSVQLDDFPEFPVPMSPKALRINAPAPEPEVAMSRSTGDIREESPRNDDEQPAINESAPGPKSKDTAATRQKRQRAHTTSLSTPTGGYALFPPAYSGNRI